ncbi:MAG TPA: helix-turn-helix domain-containing protein [Ideonella sp.]|uniref:helix-turn-helix domain-containing protein n=1 Tax=Ideonella sp. TaxID=1929293 RepID=UPI002D12FDBA|nr:helix-turn-helix domain-containing protein [Ideonella sp.]HSI50807.1 helix-turn-helix domain-containing protein [Ideonella sp.]
MVAAFPVRFPDQLRQHLRALRKRHDLTQAQLGALIGVSQARIAEIEANPGLVNFEQLMKLLSVLGVSLTLQEGTVAPAASSVPAARASRPKAKIATKPQPKSAPGQSKGDPVRRTGPSAPNPDLGVQPASRRDFVARPKKGSW